MDSGWNWSPKWGYSLCRIDITVEFISSDIVVGTKLVVFKSNTCKEWYRVTEIGLFPLSVISSHSGSIALMFLFNKRIFRTCPCIGSGAKSTVAPYTVPNIWWPRQTPNMGNLLFCRIQSRDRAYNGSSGWPGPGDRITPSNGRKFWCSCCCRIRSSHDVAASAATTIGGRIVYWANISTKLYVKES